MYKVSDILKAKAVNQKSIDKLNQIETNSTKVKFELYDIIRKIITEEHIIDNYCNYSYLRHRLIDVINRHGLPLKESKPFYSIVQVNTFIREIKPDLITHSWIPNETQNSLQIKIFNLGNDLDKEQYTVKELVKYVIKHLNIAYEQHNIESITKQILRIDQKYQLSHLDNNILRWTCSQSYELIVALKPFLIDRNNTTIIEFKSHGYQNTIVRLNKKYQINDKVKFKTDLINYNVLKFSQIQKERYKYNNHPVYFTDHEINTLDHWAKNWRKREQDDALPKQPINNNVVHGNHCSREITNFIIKVNNLKNSKHNIKCIMNYIYSKVPKLNKNNQFKHSPYGNKCTKKCIYYTDEVLDYFKQHCYDILPTWEKNDEAIDVNDNYRPDDTQKSELDDMSANEIGLSQMNDIQIQTKQVNNNWDKVDRSLLTVNPFSLNVQNEILLHRYLTDKYEIDTESWKADQDALNKLDYHTPAYDNIYKRLLHPEINYVKKR